jgi:superfamily I DNA/RNA helicase
MTTTKGQAFYSLVKLEAGERVSNIELSTLIKHTGIPYLARGAKKRVRSLMDGMYELRDLKEMGFTEFFTDALRNGFEGILNRDIEKYERRYLMRVLKRYGPRAFEEPAKITITTIHGSKGREKPAVYLCPDLTRKVWDGYTRDRIPETLVFYVGATRAIDKLVVLAPEQYYSFALPR